MASVIYPKWKQAVWEGNCPDLTDEASNPIRLILIDEGSYTYSAAHDFLDDVPAGARIDTSGDWTSVTGTNGILQGTCPAFTSVAGGSTVNAAILYQHTGTEGTSRLIAFIDDLSYATNGANITITVPTPFITL